jgi:glycosyltransferase involved in cell wall biosynthesis
MQGGINFETFRAFNPPFKDEKISVMYSGHLSEVTGVDILIKAIKNNKRKDLKFYISGKGPLENSVKDCASRDSRVEFLGYMPEVEYSNFIKNVNILLNPRNMSLPQNQNNFPSKILEFLATGRPIISTEFPGYQAFEKNIRFYNGSIESLNNMIDEVCDNYRRISIEIYSANRSCALSYDWEVQCKRISNFLQE